MQLPSSLSKRYRFPGESISPTGWRSYRFLTRAEHSHRPTRRRERVRQRFTSPEHAQPFLAPFGPISDHVRPRRHHLPASEYHHLLHTRFVTWREVTALAAA